MDSKKIKISIQIHCPWMMEHNLKPWAPNRNWALKTLTWLFSWSNNIFFPSKVHWSKMEHLISLILCPQPKKQEKHKQGKTKDQAIILVHEMKLGFGNVTATAENLPTGFGQLKPPETFYVLNKAVGCCSRLSDCCCCMCFIRTCSKLNDQCVIAMTQLCTALSCFACLECCTGLCCSDGSD